MKYNRSISDPVNYTGNRDPKREQAGPFRYRPRAETHTARSGRAHGDSPGGLTPGTYHRDSSQGLGHGDSPRGLTHGDPPPELTRGTHPRDSRGGLTHRDSSRGLTRGLTHGDPPPGLTHRDSPRSVLGPASRCLNLSSREASLSLKAELLRAPGSGAPPSTTVAACGRDWDLCKGAASLALPARRGAGGEER